MTDTDGRPLRGEDGARYVSAREQLAIDRLAAGENPTAGALIPLPTSDRIDRHAAADLVQVARDLASAAALDGHTPNERLYRVSLAHDAVADVLTAAALLDPYAPGTGHTRVGDVIVATGVRTRAGHLLADSLPGVDHDRAAAIDRLELDRQTRELRHLVRAWSDAGPFLDPAHATHGPAVLPPSPARWLNDPAYVTRTTAQPGPGKFSTLTWEEVPDAHLDYAPGDSVEVANTTIVEGEGIGWHYAAAAYDVSGQLLEWSVNGPETIDAVLTASVDTTLERAMVADLIAGAPTAASIPEAEALVGGAWAPGPDVILVSGGDRPTVAREYATANLGPEDRPTILGTAGVPAGQAVVLASPLVDAEASPLEWLVADDPKLFGRDLAAGRAGIAYTRQPGGVVTVPLA